ncbi:MAG: DUF4271 domain-containing protein [Bacteroidales bacterium]|nr:DUF4271 domain-containing protein [Bacteroidales bacterium]
MALFSDGIVEFDWTKVPAWETSFQDVFVVVSSVVLVLLAVLFTFYRRECRQMLQGLFVTRICAQILRDSSNLRERLLIGFYPFVLLTQSLLIYFLLHIFDPLSVNCLYSIVVWLIALGIVVVDMLLKMFLTRFFLYLSDYDKSARLEYELYKRFYQFDTAFILFPILLIAVFSGVSHLLFVYVFAFVFIHICMFVRLLLLNVKRKNLFQFFLYFCTVEILPYIIVLKTALLLGK